MLHMGYEIWLNRLPILLLLSVLWSNLLGQPDPLWMSHQYKNILSSWITRNNYESVIPTIT